MRVACGVQYQTPWQPLIQYISSELAVVFAVANLKCLYEKRI
jgi:hypothetical protein